MCDSGMAEFTNLGDLIAEKEAFCEQVASDGSGLPLEWTLQPYPA